MRPWSIRGQRPLSGWRAALSLRVPWWRLDWPILLLGLVLFGLGLVFVASIAEADELFGHPQPMAAGRQVQKALIVAPVLVVGLLVRPRWLRRHAYLLYGLALVLVCLVPFLGEERNGARRWIPLPIGFDLQPSELMKLGAILALARALHRTRLQRARDWLTPALLALVPMAFVAAQPDLGTALTLAPISLGLFWVAGARTRILAALVVTGALVGGAAWRMEWIHGYQKKRIDTWVSCLDPEVLIANKNGAAYHPYWARVSIGNGGLTGRGLGRGVANESGNLPERDSDSIFAVVAEEGGFLGASAFVVIYLSFAGLFLVAAGRTRERFSKLVITGAGLYFASHFAINAGVNLGLLPMTGLTLPLLSTGGSSLLVSLAFLGLALGLSARAEVVLDSDSFQE